MKRLTLIAALALFGCAEEPPPEADEVAELPPSDCRPVTFDEVRFTVCSASPDTHSLQMAWADANSQPFRSIAEYAADRPIRTSPVAFAMNGGMFDNSGKPIGYYVEDKDRIVELNRRRGPGNFHLLPNGVFYIDGDEWVIRTSDDFYENVSDRPDYGTQSGPMLVIDGDLHPQLDDDGPSRFIRNAVGIDTKGDAHFAISEEPVSFGKIARLYRDELNVPNALYLDGTVSALWDPARDRLDGGAPIGPLIVALKRETAATTADETAADAKSSE